MVHLINTHKKKVRARVPDPAEDSKRIAVVNGWFNKETFAVKEKRTIKTEPEVTAEYHSVVSITPEFEELHDQIKSKVARVEGTNKDLLCTDCGFISNHKSVMYDHVEARHVTHPGVTCQMCGKTGMTRNAHRVHLIARHKAKVTAKK